jgi:hypothetical protein
MIGANIHSSKEHDITVDGKPKKEKKAKIVKSAAEKLPSSRDKVFLETNLPPLRNPIPPEIPPPQMMTVNSKSNTITIGDANSKAKKLLEFADNFSKLKDAGLSHEAIKLMNNCDIIVDVKEIESKESKEYKKLFELYIVEEDSSRKDIILKKMALNQIIKNKLNPYLLMPSMFPPNTEPQKNILDPSFIEMLLKKIIEKQESEKNSS